MEQKIYLKVEGMMCHHCSGRVQKTLEETEGVILAEASHERGDAYVETNGKITEEELIKIINDLGYKASKWNIVKL